MDRSSQKEKSSRKSREERERDSSHGGDHKHRSSKDHRDDDNRRHRHRHHKHGGDDDSADQNVSSKHHHRSRHSKDDNKHHRYDDDDDEEEHVNGRSRARSHDRGDSKREISYDDHRRSREYSEIRDSKREREESRDRDEVYDRNSRREKSYEREGSRDRMVNSHKRKERGESEDRSDAVGEKRARVFEGSKEERRESRRHGDKLDGEMDKKERREKDSKEERKARRRFEDRREEDDSKTSRKDVKVKEEGVEEERNGGERRGEKRKYEDKKIKEEIKVKEEINANMSGSGSLGNSGVGEPINVSSRPAPETFATNNHSATKVSPISTTNENKGSNITGSHEVTGKSSTDGTSTTAGKSGNLSLDALTKAKKALQMQKELSKKLKKIPLLNKGTGSNSAASTQGSQKEGIKAPSTAGILPTPSAPTSTMAGRATGVSNLPAAAAAAAANSGKPLGGMDPGKYEAVRRAQELAARMGFRQDPEFAPLINLFPVPTPPDVSVLQKPAKAPVLRLDALGREIDEHGNVVNLSKPSNLSTLKVNINKQKKEAFQILKPELEVNPEENPHYDPRMGIDKNKLLRPKRMSFQFVEEGKWSKEAEIIKLKNQFGDAQAKELKAKQAQLAKAKAEPNINPNLIEVSERVITKEKPKEPIPVVEWWDVPLLRNGNYGDIADDTPIEDRIKTEKLTIYVEHPRPIEPPAEPAPPPPQPLKLTKKEQKKLRTQRRLAREKERQEMIRQGLIEPPKPKVKMSNLMKVLGSEATQDPTKLEMEIRAAAAEREQAHVDRNIARKLTPAERREKKERKLFDDPSTLDSVVSVYKVSDLSHPQNRFKVDVNAQENRLTGCAVIFEGFSVVVVEGGSKSIKRYGKLMLRRINWAASTNDVEDDEDEAEEKPVNKCVLVWQGSVSKPSFNKFLVHECRTEAAARKVFSDAGVGHYWDLAANFSSEEV